MGKEQNKEQNKAYEMYLTFCIDLGRSLGAFLEVLEQTKIDEVSDLDKENVDTYYKRASALHDHVGQEISDVVKTKKELVLRVVPKK